MVKMSRGSTDAGSSMVGTRHHIIQPWRSLDTFGVLQLKAVARMQGCVTERRRLQGVFNFRAKRDREVYFNKLTDKSQEGLRHNNLRPSYHAIRQLARISPPPLVVHMIDGSSCDSTEDVLRR